MPYVVVQYDRDDEADFHEAVALQTEIMHAVNRDVTVQPWDDAPEPEPPRAAGPGGLPAIHAHTVCAIWNRNREM